MIFKYPYTDLYNLNLDWVIQAIKEVQQTITDLGTVVNTFNGESGDVTLDAAGIASIVGGIVNSFNGRSGAVELTEADVNATLIDIVWTSDPGEVIGDLTQTALNELFAAGRRVLIFNNALGEPDRIYFLTLVNDVPTPQQYIPTGAIAGVASVNGQTGAVTVRGDTIPVSGTDPTTVEDALAAKEDVLTFDSTPTSGSSNPVTSAGIEAADGAIRTSLETLSGTVSGINNRLEAAEQDITDLGPYNGLDSDSTTAALAAAQGKALSQQIENLGPYNGLDSTSTTEALAASQGKILSDLLNIDFYSESGDIRTYAMTKYSNRLKAFYCTSSADGKPVNEGGFAISLCRNSYQWGRLLFFPSTSANVFYTCIYNPTPQTWGSWLSVQLS